MTRNGLRERAATAAQKLSQAPAPEDVPSHLEHGSMDLMCQGCVERSHVTLARSEIARFAREAEREIEREWVGTAPMAGHVYKKRAGEVIRALADEYDTGCETTASPWIPTTERLPSLGDRVIVWSEYLRGPLDATLDDNCWRSTTSGSLHEMKTVSHWRPALRPPNEYNTEGEETHTESPLSTSRRVSPSGKAYYVGRTSRGHEYIVGELHFCGDPECPARLPKGEDRGSDEYDTEGGG